MCNNQPYGFPSDVWSLGIVLFELLSLDVPFRSRDVVALVSQVLHRNRLTRTIKASTDQICIAAVALLWMSGEPRATASSALLACALTLVEVSPVGVDVRWSRVCRCKDSETGSEPARTISCLLLTLRDAALTSGRTPSRRLDPGNRGRYFRCRVTTCIVTISNQIVRQVIKAPPPPLPEIYSDEVTALARWMLQKDPLRRPSLSQVYTLRRQDNTPPVLRFSYTTLASSLSSIPGRGMFFRAKTSTVKQRRGNWCEAFLSAKCLPESL